MKYTVEAPVAGRIEDTHYEMGEVATAGIAGALAPPGQRAKGDLLRAAERRAPSSFQAALSRSPATAARKTSVAKITFLGTEAEYTPPVIFSRENRGKLMFRAEAHLDGEAAKLPVGQPVDVTPTLRGSQ